jgi:hypothetical protein
LRREHGSRHSLNPIHLIAQEGIIMNKLILTLMGGLAFSAALPALAGPDWELIEHGRALKQAAAHHADDTQSTTQTSIHRSPSRLVLPLDHGPRAQTTPQANQVRVRQYDAQLNTGVASN